MIKEELVQVRLNPANKKHYFSHGYTGEMGEVIDVLTTHLTKSSLTKITRICEDCGSEKVVTMKKYYPKCKCCASEQYVIENKKPANLCDDCGVELTNRKTARCKSCHYKFMVGENNPNYGKGDKIRGENNVNWKGGMPKCLDCGIELTNRNYKDIVRERCRPCRDKFYVGENHAFYNRDNHFCSCGEPKGRHSDACMKCYLESIHNPLYNGRSTAEQNRFARLVKIRDNGICNNCGAIEESMVAHHLEAFNINIEGRDNPDNGVCLCKDCHITFHKMYGFGGNTTEQYLEFKEKYNGSN